MAEIYNGALLDERDASAKALDFHHEEVPLAGGEAKFPEITRPDQIPFYELRDQDGSSTCMNQAYAKLRGIVTRQRTGRYVSLSGGFAYRRKHTAGEGMALWDIMALGKDHGLPFELIDPSQNMNESQIVNAKEIMYADDVAKLFTDKSENYVYLPLDFDAIAEVISQGYPVVLMLFANRGEYDIIPNIEVPDLDPYKAQIRHGVCAHYTCRYEGVDYIVMDDSWGVPSSTANGEFQRELRGRGQRLLTREFVNSRVYGAAYIRDLNFNFGGAPIVTPPDLQKPKHTFKRRLQFVALEDYGGAVDMAQRDDVKALQNILKYEGIFDKNVQSSGYYGAITARAVEAYQRKHAVASKEEIDSITGPNSVVGPKTLADLNNRYAQ